MSSNIEQLRRLVEVRVKATMKLSHDPELDRPDWDRFRRGGYVRIKDSDSLTVPAVADGVALAELWNADLPAILAEMEADKAKIEIYEDGIKKHNEKMAGVPCLGKRPESAPEGLRFLAKWMTAMYPNHPDREVEDDLEKWANEIEADKARIAKLEAVVEAAKIMVEAQCDYMRINHLGDPYKQYPIANTLAALAALEGGQQ